MSIWQVESATLKQPRGIRLEVRSGALPLTYVEVIGLWRTSDAFRAFFGGALAAMPYRALRWETPPLTHEYSARSFECVALDSPDLLRAPEPDVFAGEFSGRRAPDVISFPNLGGDARMIVPCPGEPASAYAHLAAFLREAPIDQCDRLWQAVGQAMAERMSDVPIWLNTAGAGVAWLHMRLDSRPKYYHYRPYCTSRDA